MLTLTLTIRLHREHGMLMVHGNLWFMVQGQLTVHGSWFMVND